MHRVRLAVDACGAHQQPLHGSSARNQNQPLSAGIDFHIPPVETHAQSAFLLRRIDDKRIQQRINHQEQDFAAAAINHHVLHASEHFPTAGCKRRVEKVRCGIHQ